MNTDREIAILKTLIEDKRLKHSVGVADSARELAEIYGELPDRAYLAGLLHDCAKRMNRSEQLSACKRNNIDCLDAEVELEKLLHAPAGAAVAAEKFKVTDKEILSAIRWHTLGRCGMTVLEKIIYIADFIEVNRSFCGVEELRALAKTDLDKAVLQGLNGTISKLNEKGLEIVPYIYEVRDYYEGIINNNWEQVIDLMDSKQKALKAAQILSDKKALDIEVIEITDLSTITDFFVICAGTSSTHIKALSDEVELKLKENGITPGHVEGYNTASWILLDYHDVIIHVFNKESRMFYSIERLWADAKRVPWEE